MTRPRIRGGSANSPVVRAWSPPAAPPPTHPLLHGADRMPAAAAARNHKKLCTGGSRRTTCSKRSQYLRHRTDEAAGATPRTVSRTGPLFARLAPTSRAMATQSNASCPAEATIPLIAMANF